MVHLLTRISTQIVCQRSVKRSSLRVGPLKGFGVTSLYDPSSHRAVARSRQRFHSEERALLALEMAMAAWRQAGHQGLTSVTDSSPTRPRGANARRLHRNVPD